mgnify:CR=1 FL=1
MSKSTIHELYRGLVSGQLSRREFMTRAAALGVSASAAGMSLRAASVHAREPAKPPPVVAEGDGTLFAGQEINIQVIDASVKEPLDEVREEFEAATVAKLNIIADPIETAFAKLLEDAATGTNSIDGSVIGMWWLGELVAGDFVRSYDDFYDDKETGFDAVFENPVFAGADTSYWIRQTIPFAGGGRVVSGGAGGEGAEQPPCLEGR